MGDYEKIKPIDALGNKFKTEEAAGVAGAGTPAALPQTQAPGDAAECDSIEISEEASEEQGVSSQNFDHLKGELASIKQDLISERGIVPGQDAVKAPEYNTQIQTDLSLVNESKKTGFKIPENSAGVSSSVIGDQKNSGAEAGGVYLSPSPGGEKVAQAGGGTVSPEIAKTQYDFAGSLAEGVALPENTENQVLKTFSENGLGLSAVKSMLGS
ncbi:MAG: hypothetical protein M1269_06465 [Chloroflexi bacterium]|nr:hypothetical protein [Chloroflexota bacterium]